LSWSQIGERLNVGRTTARRLCQNRGSARGGQVVIVSGSGSVPGLIPFRNGASNVPESGPGETRGDDPAQPVRENPEDNEALPESFQLFQTLLRRAREQGMGAK